MEALSLTEIQRTRRKTRKIRNVLKQSPEKVELKYEVKPDKLNRTESAKLNRTDTLPQNNTKETASFSMLTVTQSLSSAKDSEKTKKIDAEKQILQNKVTERHKYQIDRKTHKKTIAEDKRHRIKTDTKAQRSGSECGELGQCGVPDSVSPHIEGPLRGEKIPIPRTDEAVWAAGALGFLLVLLTLSVLHTRLYRHCRSSTSLYWHDNQQDYENVGGEYTLSSSSCCVNHLFCHFPMDFGSTEVLFVFQTSSAEGLGWLAGGRGEATRAGDRNVHCCTPAMRRTLTS